MRGLHRVALVLLLGASGGCDACSRGGESPSGGTEASAPTTGEEPVAEEEGTEGAEAGSPGAARADAGPAAACAGAEVDAARALADARCAVGAIAVRKLRAAAEDAGVASRLVQRAVAEEDGSVTLRITNTGKRSVTLPLLDHPDLPAFTVLAQEAGGGLLELAPPTLSASAVPGDGGVFDGGARRSRFARVRLPAGGALVARLVPSTEVRGRLSPPCEAGPCAPRVLAPGAYILHVGQLFVDLETGPPARVAWLAR